MATRDGIDKHARQCSRLLSHTRPHAKAGAPDYRIDKAPVLDESVPENIAYNFVSNNPV